eukprot:2349194-Rhodomonas_salina.1
MVLQASFSTASYGPLDVVLTQYWHGTTGVAMPVYSSRGARGECAMSPRVSDTYDPTHIFIMVLRVSSCALVLPRAYCATRICIPRSGCVVLRVHLRTAGSVWYEYLLTTDSSTDAGVGMNGIFFLPTFVLISDRA